MLCRVILLATAVRCDLKSSLSLHISGKDALPNQPDVHMTTVCAKLDSNASYSSNDIDDGRFYANRGANQASLVNVIFTLTIVWVSLGFSIGTKLW